MLNPPNGRPPKSFDTNKKKRLFSASKKTFGNHRLGSIHKILFVVSPYYQRAYIRAGRPESHIFNAYRMGKYDQP